MKKPRRIFRERREPDYVRVAQCKGSRYDPNDVQFIAMHEAGHAVSAIVLGYKLKSVDIKNRRSPNGRLSGGFADSGKVNINDVRGKGEVAALPHIVQCLTGPLAESMVNPVFVDYGAHLDDFESARRVAAVALCDAIEKSDRMEITSNELKRMETEVNSLFSAATDDAGRLVNDHSEAIVRVAELLVERKHLSGDEVAAIVEEFRPRVTDPRPTEAGNPFATAI
jgi:hypothetical protein